MSTDILNAKMPTLNAEPPAGFDKHFNNRTRHPAGRRKMTYLALTVIVLLAACIRLFRLGEQSYWYDEVCHVLVALAPTVQDVFIGSRQQIMAMPLDFIVVWLFARIGTQETILRLPAVIWGTLSILIAYRLFSRLTKNSTALLAILLLSLSPIHVRYSQEVRYYSSLVFFYLLATDCLFAAIQRPARWRWFSFVLVVVIGTYFHPFVLLCFFNGLAWLVLQGDYSDNINTRWVPFLISGCVAMLAFSLAYFSFATKTTPINMDRFEIFVVYGLLVGLDWIPQVYVPPGLGWIWGLLNLIFGLVGFIFSIRSSNSNLKALAISIFAQIVVLTIADYFLYFPEPRQFIEILPLMLLMAALGASEFLQKLRRGADHTLAESQVKTARMKRVLGCGLICLWIFSSVPALSDYYNSDRSRALAISRNLAASWSPGNRIFVMPDTIFRSETIVYTYYLRNVLGLNAIISSIKGTDWIRLEKDSHCPCKIYLITTVPGPSPFLLPEQQTALSDLGYRPLPLSKDDDTYLQRLWIKE